MENWCVAYPAVTGQTKFGAKELPEQIRARLDEYTKSRKAAGVALERTFLMTTPKGDFFVTYGESALPFEETMKSLVDSPLQIDKDLMTWQHQLTGIDVGTTPMATPERVFDFAAPDAKRGRGLAFTAPVPAERLDELKDFFAKERSSVEEIRASRLALGLIRSSTYITKTPMGAICTVYIEAADPVVANEKFAASTNAFDVRLKSTVGPILGIDFNQPLPPIEQVWSYPESI